MNFLWFISEQYRHSRLYRVFLLLLLAGFCKQMLHYTALIDSAEYLQAAHNLQHGHWSVCGQLLPCGTHWLEATRRTPGYPLFIMLSAYLPLLFIAVQLIPAALVPVWSIRLLKQFSRNAKSQQLLMAAFLLYPLQFFYSNLLMPEIWVQWLLLCCLVYLCEKQYSLLPWLISALILLKPVFIIFLPLCFLFMIKAPKQRMLQLLPLLVFLLISTYNKRQTGWFHYSSMAVENAYEYNIRAVMNRVNSAKEIDSLLHNWDEHLHGLNYAERAAFMQHISREKISAHLMLYLYLHARGALAVLLDPGRYDLVAFFRLNEGSGFMDIKKQSRGLPPVPVLLYMGIFLLWRLLLLVLVLRLLLHQWQGRLVLLLLPVLLLMAAAGPVGSARYLFPVAPLIFVMAAAGFTAKKHALTV